MSWRSLSKTQRTLNNAAVVVKSLQQNFSTESKRFYHKTINAVVKSEGVRIIEFDRRATQSTNPWLVLKSLFAVYLNAIEKIANSNYLIALFGNKLTAEFPN